MADQYQYVKLPDGSYGKFAANASDKEIRALVAKHFPAAYQAKPATGPKSQIPDWKPADTLPPENARFPGAGRTAYKAADFIGGLLPAAGSTAGALATAATGPGAVAGAGAGAVLGEEASHFLKKAMYRDLPPESAKEAITSMGEQAVLGAGSEFGARAAGSVLRKLATPFKESATSIREANAGNGVRLTPGEAAGNPMVKLGETVLEHLPGGSGPMRTFRAAQESDAIGYLGKQLDALSSQNLTSEQAGEAVQKAIREAKSKSDALVGSKFDQARTILGKKPGEYLTAEDFDKAIAASEKPGSILGPDGKPIKSFAIGDRARKALAEARSTYQQENSRFDQEILGKVLQTQKPEIIGGFFEKAGLDDLRALKTVLPPEVQQNAARNVLDNIITRSADPQSGQINARNFATSVKKLGEGRGRLIFGQQYDSVLEAGKLLGRINAGSGSSMVGRMHTARVMAGAAAALGGLFGLGGLEGAVKGLATEVAFSRMLSIALTKPQLTGAALNILRGAAVSAARGIPYGVDALTSTSPGNYPQPRYELESTQP